MPSITRAEWRIFYRLVRQHGVTGWWNAVDPLAAHAALASEVERKREKGRIAICESGMDCDCVSYSNRIHVVAANAATVAHAIARIYSGAEGPVTTYLMPPTHARRLTYAARDLAAEAHENAHPHRITY
jgi:hypothetical protein